MYTDSQRQMGIGVPGTPVVFTAVAIVGGSTCFPIFRPWEIIGAAITITTAITVTDAQLTFLYRPTPGSSTGQSTLGTMILPVSGSAIGKQYWKKFTAFRALPGGEIVISVTQAATAGQGLCGVLINETTEVLANITNMVASA